MTTKEQLQQQQQQPKSRSAAPPPYLIVDGLLLESGRVGRERARLEVALKKIDDWDDNDDLNELGGDDDTEMIIAKVRSRFITQKAFAPFVAAFEQCLWLRDYSELSARKRHKAKLALQKSGSSSGSGGGGGGGESHPRDWELHILPALPETPFKRERHPWHDHHKRPTFERPFHR